MALTEFKRVGVDVDFFYAYPGVDPFASFNLSQSMMIQDAKGNGGSLLAFEDDVIFKRTDHLDAALMELPAHWGIVYLGCNITGATKKYSDHLHSVSSAWTTHALGYSEEVIKYIHSNYDPKKHGMYDDWLSKTVLPRFACFVVNPMVCWQRPCKSDLWDKTVDYTDCFVNGDKMMQG